MECLLKDVMLLLNLQIIVLKIKVIQLRKKN